MEVVFLSLGSNLGNKLANLERAIDLISANSAIEILKKSSWVANPAIEEAGPEEFLNGVIKIQTSLSPYDLLDLIRSIEAEVDSERSSRGRKLARMLDVDILLFENISLNSKELTIPHPRMFSRDFVTEPLSEIESNWREKYLDHQKYVEFRRNF